MFIIPSQKRLKKKNVIIVFQSLMVAECLYRTILVLNQNARTLCKQPSQ